VVFAEHGSTSGVTTPIAKHVIDTFFAKREGRPLPVLPPKAPVTTATNVVTAPTPPAPQTQGGGGQRR
jgi:hypothetical protein